MVKQHPKIGLVLSGGAGRGNAHIGVLKVLEREGIPVDFLAGTSMGGLIGAGYAAGISPREMETEAIRMSRLPRLLELVDRKMPRQGVITGERLHAYVIEALGGETTFDDLKIPLALVTVDINSGQEVVIRQGRVADAVRATMSVPGLVAPLEMDGRRYVDGGLLNNMPVDVARQAEVDVVIAVDVMSVSSFTMPQWLGTIAGDTQRCMSIALKHLYDFKLQQAPPDVLIDLNDYMNVNVLTGYTKATETIAAGETAAEAALPQIKQAIGP